MFSQTVEYALRAVLHLASERPEARTTQQISKATKVPKPYLYKVLKGLSRQGIVTSQRGLGGGVRLARDPSELTILDVIKSVEPIERIHKCPLGLAAHGVNLCPLHRRMDDAIARVEEAFGKTVLADLLDEPTVMPTCRFPRVASRPPVRAKRT